jgi:hypothetical protein
MPFTSIASSSGRIVTLRVACCAFGQWKLPRSRRLAQTQRPLPDQSLQPSVRAIREQEQMAAQRIFPQVVPHQSMQSFEAFAHVNRFPRNVDFRRRTQSEHYAAPAIRISRANALSSKSQPDSIRRALPRTSVKPSAARTAHPG